ncbi:uncharacterized protein FFMR_14679 [Fusarium fujikuroi]|nr:uncharacterized protein FFMR_14679 [Fusarium fujikuroi]
MASLALFRQLIN